MNDDIEARMNALEKQVRRQRWIGAVAGLCVIAAFTTGAVTDEVHDVLKAKKIVVVGNEGNELVILDDAAEGGAITIKNEDGKSIVDLFSQKKGGYLRVRSKDDKSRMFLSENQIMFVNEKDDAVLILGESKAGNGFVQTRNNNHNLVSLGGTENGVIYVYNKDGKKSAELGTSLSGAGTVSVLGKDGEKLVTLGTTTEGDGTVTTHTKDGELVRLGANDAGGFIIVTNKTGEAIVTLMADEYGNGEVGAWNRKGKGRTLTPEGS